MKRVVGITVVVGLGILVLATGPIMAQVPEGWNEYVIQPGDYLTKLALKVEGVDRNNVLWMAEEIAAVNGIQDPNFILAWTPIYIPESVEVLKKATEANLVILREKRAAPPIVFSSISKSAVEKSTDLSWIQKEIKEAGGQIAKEIRIGFAKVADVEKLKEKLVTAEEKLEALKIDKEKALAMVARFRGVERQNKWLLLLVLIGWILFVIFLISSVGLTRSLRKEREQNEDLKVENEILKRKKNQIEKEKEELKSFVPGNEIKVKAKKDGKEIEAYCKIIRTEEKEGKVRRRLICPYCDIEVWEENMPRHLRKSCKKSPFPPPKK